MKKEAGVGPFFLKKPLQSISKIQKCQEKLLSYKSKKRSYKSNQKSTMALKVQCPLPVHRIGAVKAGGTHKGKKAKLLQSISGESYLCDCKLRL